jgi:hypothetical protein
MSAIILKDPVYSYINVSNQTFPHIPPGEARKQGPRGNRSFASPTQALLVVILTWNSVPQASKKPNLDVDHFPLEYSKYSLFLQELTGNLTREFLQLVLQRMDLAHFVLGLALKF